jgi:hypothetical protein
MSDKGRGKRDMKDKGELFLPFSLSPLLLITNHVLLDKNYMIF